MIAVVVVGIVVVVGVMFWFAYQQNKKHRALLSTFAQQHGWSYVDADNSYCSRWDGHPFGQGHSRKAQNIMTGSYNGHDVVAFDYQYAESTTNGQGQTSDTTYRFSIYVLRLPSALPPVSITPEGFFSKVGHAIGVHDIQFESEAFNRAFRVKSDDSKLAYDLLPARNMELLMTQDNVHLRSVGESLLCVDRKWLDPARITSRLDLMVGLVGNVPAFVWADHRAGGTA